MHNKFVKRDTKLTNLIENSLKNGIKKRVFELNNEVFSIEDLTSCQRKIIYKSLGVLNSEEESISTKTIDREFVVKKWIYLFSRCKGLKVVDSNITVSDGNYNLSGTTDIVVKCKDVLGAINIEPVNQETYSLAKNNNGLRRHIIKLMSILWLTELENGILIYENKNDNDYFLLHVIVNPAVIESIKNKYELLIKNKVFGEIPDRPYKNSENNECKNCVYLDKCWIDNKKKER